jgi:hypothetical protein
LDLEVSAMAGRILYWHGRDHRPSGSFKQNWRNPKNLGLAAKRVSRAGD